MSVCSVLFSWKIVAVCDLLLVSQALCRPHSPFLQGTVLHLSLHLHGGKRAAGAGDCHAGPFTDRCSCPKKPPAWRTAVLRTGCRLGPRSSKRAAAGLQLELAALAPLPSPCPHALFPEGAHSILLNSTPISGSTYEHDVTILLENKWYQMMLRKSL